jgi:hypothetical protein
MVNHEERFIGVGPDASGKAATRRVIYDQSHDISPLLIAQCAYSGEHPDPIDHAIKVVEVLAVRFVVVDQFLVDKAQFDITDTAVCKRLVCLFNRQVDEISVNINVLLDYPDISSEPPQTLAISWFVNLSRAM